MSPNSVNTVLKRMGKYKHTERKPHEDEQRLESYLEGTWPCLLLDFGFLASGTMKE